MVKVSPQTGKACQHTITLAVTTSTQIMHTTYITCTGYEAYSAKEITLDTVHTTQASAGVWHVVHIVCSM